MNPALSPPTGHHLCIARRQALAAALASALAGRPRRAAAAAAVDDAVAALLPPAFRPSGRVLMVRNGDDITAALDTALEGDTIVLARGPHAGRAVLARRVALLGGGGADATTLAWRMDAPYQSTVAARAPGCVVGGLTITHASPSVANNYAVHAEGGAAGFTLTGCDVVSTTGTGVGLDAAECSVEGCTIHECARFGVAVFGDGVRVTGCRMRSNRSGGVLVRGATGVVVSGGVPGGVQVVGGGSASVDGVEVGSL